MKYQADTDKVYGEMSRRVDEYFKSTGQSRFANSEMYLKTFTQFSVFVITYIMMLSNQFHSWDLFLLQIVNGCFLFFMSVGIAHDASHSAYSSNQRVNKVLNAVFDFIGIDSDVWVLNHIQGHHAAPNVPKFDPAIDSFLIFRFHPEVKYSKVMRYQHLYIFGLYAVSTLYKWFVLDFFSAFRKEIGATKDVRKLINPKVLVKIFGAKLLVFSYTLFIPMMVISVPWYQYMAGFIAFHILNGIMIGLIFQVTHLSDRTKFVYPKNEKIEDTYVNHIFTTTADFCVQNKLVAWVGGGLNMHVAHHLFPGYCQIHLPALTKIVKEVAEENGLPYHEYKTLKEAVTSHSTILRELGEPTLNEKFILRYS